MAQLILRLDDGDEMILNGHVDGKVVEAFHQWFGHWHAFDDERSWWTTSAAGRSNSSDSFVHLVDRVYELLSGGCGSIIAEGWRRSTAGLIMAQLAHVHGVAPLLPPDPERIAR